MRKSFPCLCAAALTAAMSSAPAMAREQLNIVGSSTVYPFATVVAERFGKKTAFKTPKVEATGSGGGLKLFCEGVGVKTPDIANASRRIKQSEIDKCRANGVSGIIEVKIGYDGIVIAHAKRAANVTLSLRTIFLALAKEVPDPGGAQKLVPNPYKKWHEIDAALPAQNIEVLGPPPTSGTRDAFAELALEGGCKTFDWLKAMKKTDKPAYKQACHSVREDGAYIEAGENDNLIVHKLKANPHQFGVFGYSFLEQNSDIVKGVGIGEIMPTFEDIASGAYPVSRALYFYAKKAHVGVVPGVMEYIKEFMSDAASGDDGYLGDKGMIPLSPEERAQSIPAIMQQQVLPATLAAH